MQWNLDRPRPALPSSYFWTWDHSTNWVLDDPGIVTFGCNNRYLKRPETFLEDYCRLTDFAAGLGVKGILIWGFLRDCHGGIEAGRQLADYAAERGVAIMPGVGTTAYGGFYYEGDHRFNIETFLRDHPDARMVTADGQRHERCACPSDPAFLDWLREGMEWMYEEFAIGGVNLENGDFLVCCDERCRAHKDQWPADEPDFFRLQAMSYVPALETVADRLPQTLGTYATYTGFAAGEAPAGMGCDAPLLTEHAPEQGITQWTLTAMVRQQALPLTAWLDDGAPQQAFDNPVWTADLRPPVLRSVGFCHQGSQWSAVPRYNLIVSTIKEACLRAHRAGLEGLSIHGEVTSRHIPWALNYLAFSHFIHWPEDTLRQFGRNTLGQVLADEDEGELFAEALAHLDAGSLSDRQRDDVRRRTADLRGAVARGEQLERWRFWDWLCRLADGRVEPHTASFF